MGRWLLLVIVVIVAASPEIAFLYISKKHQVSPESKNKREAAYQSSAQSYAANLKLGLPRKDVEAYLRTKRVGFTRMCCIEQHGAFADLVQIGQEEHPWFCNENYVYVAFEFTGTGSTPDSGGSDTDALKKISIFRQLGGCL